MTKIKSIIKKTIPSSLLRNYREIHSLNGRVSLIEEQIRNKWLLEKIPKIKDQKLAFKLNEFKIFSQTGEDGIINYIFSKIGVKNKTFVEFGIQDGKECNTANLSLNFGWGGFLIEGDRDFAEKAKEYYAGKPVKVINSFITKENINKIFLDNGIKGEIDLLVIDIDGNDYWVWKEIDSINPRVVVMEYNSVFGNKPITIKYKSNFDRLKNHKSGLYFGASLSALAKLGKEKGYILVGCCSSGFNAFFVREDIARNKFSEMNPANVFYEDVGNIKKFGDLNKQFDIIKNLEFENIGD